MYFRPEDHPSADALQWAINTVQMSSAEWTQVERNYLHELKQLKQNLESDYRAFNPT